MMKNESFKKLAIACGFLVFGFLYPVIFESSLQELLFGHNDYGWFELFIWVLFGSAFFMVAGMITSSAIKKGGYQAPSTMRALPRVPIRQ